MRSQNSLLYSNPRRTIVRYVQYFQHGAALKLLICLVGLVSVHSLSQPLASGKVKYLGNAITDNFSFHSNFAQYWNQVTPGNSGKWGSVENNPGVYNWIPLDAIYNYALANNFPYKHHCLIWGQQQPIFMTNGSLDSASQRAEIEKWIDTVGKRYPKMSFVDVVNEPFHAPPAYANALGGNGVTGWDWVVTAFTLARQHCDTSVKLILNDYSILQDNGITTRFIALIDTLKVRGLIDGIGIQGHYFEFRSYAGASNPYTYSISTIKSNLDRLGAMGLPVYITEFDINEADDNTQLQNYQTYFPMFWEHPAIKGMTLWGYYYGDTWKVNANLLNDRNAERPAMVWLRNYIISPFSPVPISPNGTTNEQRNPFLVWHSSESAISYHIQVASNSGFSSVMVDTTVVDTLLQLNPLVDSTRYYWHVSAANNLGTSEYSATASFMTGHQIVDVEELVGIPVQFYLSQNYPNPFNPTTRIQYSVPLRGHVSLKVYNLLGEEVANLFDGIRQQGNYMATLDGKGLASGIYFYRLNAGNFTETKKLILLK
jgi:endo-1,4-beta-xylanase